MLARIAVLVGVTAVVATAVPQVAPQIMKNVAGGATSSEPPARERRSSESAPARHVAPAPAPRRGSGRQVVIDADRRGHFMIETRVGSRSVEMMFDTGATSVALNDETARQLGIYPSRSDFRLPISTANGVILAAPVHLPSLSVGGIRLSRVEAVIVPGGALTTNLLGMSFLGRLRNFEVAGDRLVLSQ